MKRLSILLSLLSIPLACSPAIAKAQVTKLVDVDTPEIGEGLAFRGAVLPFGMVMFGPNG
jgi:putative alpha-1,2-mannosidase